MKNYRKSILLIILVFSLFISSCGFENEYSEDETVSRPPLNNVDNESRVDFSEDEPLLDIKGKD